MAHRIVWSFEALADVEAIGEYIEKDSVFYARAVIGKVVAATRKLSQFPLSGRIVPEMMDSSLREVFAFSYRIIYHVGEGVVTIVAVVHGKRMLEINDEDVG